jgi:hypothetical protein
MRVLESPITWIALAAVLVVVALLLFLLAALRRRRAKRAAAAAAWPPPAIEPALGERTATTRPAEPEPETAPIDVDAVRARLAAETPAPPEPAEEPRRPRHAASDEHVGVEKPPDTESAKDRLLAVLLHDPRGAVDALTSADRDAGPSAAALLRAGLTPAQVARLVGVEEQRLATVVAQGLGLLAAGQGSGGATGENRTDDPGRSWANTASSAGSTTPTTG